MSFSQKCPHAVRAVALAVAEELRGRGYDAHAAYAVGGDIKVRAVHLEGWRYPDGHWEFHDSPAEISVFTETDEQHVRQLRCSFVDHRGEMQVPVYGSPAAIADWITQELPPAGRPTCQLEHHPNFIDADSGAIPPDWCDCWSEHDEGVPG